MKKLHATLRPCINLYKSLRMVKAVFETSEG